MSSAELRVVSTAATSHFSGSLEGNAAVLAAVMPAPHHAMRSQCLPHMTTAVIFGEGQSDASDKEISCSTKRSPGPILRS
jgi:hypothetical protein